MAEVTNDDKTEIKMPSRRSLLAMGILSPLILSDRAWAQASCGGPLSMSDRNRRRALGYVEVSKNPDRQCARCTYFSATDGGCGACQMLSGQAVSEAAVCNSFIAK